MTPLSLALTRSPYPVDFASWRQYVDAMHTCSEGTRVDENAAFIMLGVHLLRDRPKGGRQLTAWKERMRTWDRGVVDEDQLQDILKAAKCLQYLDESVFEQTDAAILDRPLSDVPRALKKLSGGRDLDTKGRPVTTRAWKRQASRLVEQLGDLPDGERDAALLHLQLALELWLPGVMSLSTPEPPEVEPGPRKSRRAAVEAALAASAVAGPA